MTLVVATPMGAHASFAVTPDDTARVSGTVYAIAQVGDRTIIGGNFTTVGGLPRTNVAAIRANGTVDPNFRADTNGVVYGLAGSADGATVYIGGQFTEASGESRANLAAVNATTGVSVPGWTANTTGTTPEVLALEQSGSRLYVSGRFGGIDGVARGKLAALDPAGNVITAFRPAPAGGVRFIDVTDDGSKLFAAGNYTRIGGLARTGVASLDASTGAAHPGFAPTRNAGSLITAMGASPNGDRLYFGIANNEVYAWDVATNTRMWTVKNGGDTQAIAATNSEVWLGGHFSQNQTFKQPRKWIASFTRDGVITPWDPKLAGGSMGVWAIELTATKLLVGGEFTTANGAICRRFARFSLAP